MKNFVNFYVNFYINVNFFDLIILRYERISKERGDYYSYGVFRVWNCRIKKCE